jgi:hypothetical protein
LAVGGGEAGAGGAERRGKRAGRILGDGRTVPDGDGGRGEPAERAPWGEGSNERVDAEPLVVDGEEVADGAEHVGRDEQAPVRKPEHDLVPAGEADDPPRLDPGRQRGSDADAVTGGDGIGVAAVAPHEDGDADDRGRGERFVEVRGIDGIGEEPTIVEPNRGRRTPQELVRMGEPGEAPALVEWVRLQGAGW